MKRVDLYEMYKTPATHQPPDVSALTNSTMYPNMNSVEYRSITFENTTKLLPFFETFDVNDNGKVVVAANAYTDPLWCGALYGYNDFADIDGNKNGKELFALSYTTSITKLLFLDSTTILVADTNGIIQMWSTQSSAQSANEYSLFSISKKSEHIGIILAMNVIRNGNKALKAITGTNGRCLKIWTIGPSDLALYKTYRCAHGDAITDIVSKPDTDSSFLTSSRDKSISVWDYRLALPVVDYYQGEFGYNSISWSTNFTQILAGNETGEVHIFDSRNLKSTLQQVQGFNSKPIHKIKTNCNNKNFVAVLGQSNVVKVFDIKNDFKLVYEDDSATDYVRDVHWCGDKSNTLYSIGWKKHTGIHKVNTQMKNEKC